MAVDDKAMYPEGLRCGFGVHDAASNCIELFNPDAFVHRRDFIFALDSDIMLTVNFCVVYYLVI